MNGKRSHNFRVFTNSFAYFMLIVIAMLMVASRFVSQDVSIVLENIVKYSTLFVVAMASFWYAVSKRSAVSKVIWFIAVACIVVLIFV